MATRSQMKAADQQARVSSISDIKKLSGGLLTLPSGVTVKWRNPGGIRALMGTGKIPNSLLPIVEQALKGGKGVEDQVEQDMLKSLEENPELIAEMTLMYDEVMIKSITEPRIHRVPTEEDVIANNREHPDAPVEDPEDLRYEDRLYVDEFPDEDKMFVFQLVSGGTKDLETFRQQYEVNVASLASKSGNVVATVGDDGTEKG